MDLGEHRIVERDAVLGIEAYVRILDRDLDRLRGVHEIQRNSRSTVELNGATIDQDRVGRERVRADRDSVETAVDHLAVLDDESATAFVQDSVLSAAADLAVVDKGGAVVPQPNAVLGVGDGRVLQSQVA